MVRPRTDSNSPVNSWAATATFCLGAVSVLCLGCSIIVASLALVLPSKYLVKEGDLIQPPPIIDVIPRHYREDCPNGSTPIASITIPPTLLPEACVCPRESSTRVDSRQGTCPEALASHGCISVGSAMIPHPSDPFERWEHNTDAKVCVKRGGTPLISYKEGLFSIRPSYDPSDPYSPCPDGFRKCGNGICFDVGIQCPVYSIHRGRGGVFFATRSGRDVDFSLRVLVKFGLEEKKYGRYGKINFLSTFSSSRCSPSFQTLPEDFTCTPGDTICALYKDSSCANLAPLSTFDKRYDFVFHRERSIEIVKSLEGKSYSASPTSIPLLLPLILSPIIPICFIIFTAISWDYGFNYDEPWCCCFSRVESMTILRKRFRRIGWLTLLLLIPLSAWMCYNLYLATKVFEIPLGLFRGRGNDVAEGILVLSIINVAGMAAFFVYFFIATMWSCCNWDTHGQDLWEEEQRVVRAKAAEEQEKRKKEGIMRQVSNMSHESKQLLRAALGVAPPVIHV